MVIGVTLIVVGVLIAAIWIIIEMQRMKHKLYAVLLIALILFLYLTVTFALKGQDIDLKTVSGLGKAVGIYFNFIVSSLGNLKTLTSHAVQMDWEANETAS
jgi:uncharacterized membrane protein